MPTAISQMQKYRSGDSPFTHGNTIDLTKEYKELVMVAGNDGCGGEGGAARASSSHLNIFKLLAE